MTLKKTRIFTHEHIDEIIEALQKGELAALPTETVYGLAANIENEEALRNIFLVKGRPSDNPLIVHVASVQKAKEYVKEMPLLAEKLYEAFAPGPLTLVLEKNEKISSFVSAGLSTVALRIPAHPLFLKILEKGNFALAAPSANLSGLPSATTAEHCLQDLQGKISYILDGGPSSIGLESTVVRIAPPYVDLLRPGNISSDQIKSFLLNYDQKFQEQYIFRDLSKKHLSSQEAPASPGMKYRHYAPKGRVFAYSLQTLDFFSFEKAILEEAEKKKSPLHVGILLSKEKEKETLSSFCAFVEKINEKNETMVLKSKLFFEAKNESPVLSASRSLYASLKAMDEQGMDCLFFPFFEETALAEAYHNRLYKACGLEEKNV